MFVVGAAEPSPSGLLPLASEPTKALVKFAVAHFAALSKAHIAALSKSFGNFDRVVGIGWLIADAVRAVGAPLITRADAHAIGSKAQRKAADIKDEVRTARLAIQRAAYKLDASDPKRQELDRQLADAEAAVLRESIELPLPSGAPQAASSATGSRKRAREYVPSWDERIAAADNVVLKAQKAVSRAENREEAAEDEADGKQVRVERAMKDLRAAPSASSELPIAQFQKAAKETRKLVRRSEKAQKEWEDALFAAKDAEIAALRARLNHRDAMIDSLQLEWAYAVEREGALLDRMGWS